MGVLLVMISRNVNLIIVIAIFAIALFRPIFPMPLCPVKYLTGTWCPTCGMTTAIRQLIVGDFLAAFATHFGIIFVLLILIRASILQFTLPSTMRLMLESRAMEMGLLLGFFATCIAHSLLHQISTISV
jgi:hypothetical protein